ncbi:di-heme-cytochrome C peroxidase [Sphingomonas sp. SUN039]|uniref:di-heme-cytochrome C peroxidase n=1 Tax=Sphingomonas sp. SUN039 TaxID=2937787 RepID=UPI0021642FD2|nr:di-heme-cytochrome C peroxidase [Sphingomonas sp. SUN039]UVO54221.1 di-heme-cytochrome C peroxidase [Sphingomonas sp. SUN039]
MRSQPSRLGIIILTLCALAGCAQRWAGPPLPNSAPQGWSAKQQIAWYRGSQGSRLIPQAWLAALEDANSTTMFMDPANFARFNYLPPAPGETATLPIGFARDAQSDKGLPVTGLRWFKGQGQREPWVGLNCAACHTAEISHGGTTVRVDGAPTLADFQGFTGALRLAMHATVADPAKWARFEGRVVAPRRSSERSDTRIDGDRAMLKGAFAALLAHLDELALYNATDSVYGYGRLDAVGHILNKVAYLNADPMPIRGEPNAPVSYPFIWNAGQHDYVQWNGLVPNNFDLAGIKLPAIGPLVRNTSEVVGVFADMKTREKVGLGGYRSSVAINNLHALERQLGGLMSPAWPAAFGALDQVDVDAGKRLFAGFGCVSCHEPLERGDQKTPIVARMSPIWGANGVGTDPWMVCNTFTYQAKGGLLTGTKSTIFSGPPLPGLGPTAGYLKTQAVGVLLANKEKVIWILAKDALGIGSEIFVEEAGVEKQRPGNQIDAAIRLQACKDATAAAASDPPESQNRRTLAYKARPLNGIWATAPYLHNGSVKSLYELLLPPAQRDREFWVGNREFDVVNVGFLDAPGPRVSLFRANTGNGNSNAGHDYGNARMTETERRQLVAYMKSL